jgi:hypothetical protein
MCVIQKAAWSPALNLGLRKQFEGKFSLRGDSSTYRKFAKFPREFLSTRNFLQREGGGGGGGCFKPKFSSMGKKDTRIRNSRQAPEEGEREAQSQTAEEQVLQAEESSERVVNDDEYEKLVVQLGSSEPPGSSLMRQFASSIVRTLSGMPHATTAAAESKRNNENMEQRVKLWWNPLRMLDGGSPSATEPIRRKIADGIHRAEEDFLAVCLSVCAINPHDICCCIFFMHVKLHVTINILVLLHSRGCSQFVCLDLCKLGFDCRNALAVLKEETNCVLLNNKHGLHLKLFLSSSSSLSLSLSLFLSSWGLNSLPHA